MRVLSVGNMYPPHHLGGYELMWRSSVDHLRAVGDEVRVLTTDYRRPDPDPGIAEDPDVVRELRWYWSEHEFRRLGLRERLALERHNLDLLDRELAAFGPDAIAWWAMGGMSLSLLERARERGVAAVAVVVDEWPAYARRVDGWQAGPGALPGVGRSVGVPSRFELAPTARWLFASDYLRERAAAAGVEPAGAAVAHPGIEADMFTPAPEHDWDGRLLCLGRVDPRKGVATAIAALAALPDCTLRCVGAGDDAHQRELGELASSAGVAPRVAFEAVARERVPAELGAADALCFCVDWPEPFGIVPLEAMAVGVPVIATATGGSAEYLDHERNCLVVQPGRPEQLAHAVERLASDPALRAGLRAGGLETVAAHPQSAFDDAVRAELIAAAAAR